MRTAQELLDEYNSIKDNTKLEVTWEEYRLLERHSPYLDFTILSILAIDLKSINSLREGAKFDQDKPDMSLFSSLALEELAKVLTFGKKKYAAHNWRKGIVISRLIAAALRHLFALLRGETYDQETGLQHAAHAMCCCMFIIETLAVRKEFDDRFVVDVPVAQVVSE